MGLLEYGRLDFVRMSRWIVTGLAVFGLSLGGLLAYVPITSSLSGQAVWTIVSFSVLGLLLIQSWKDLTGFARVNGSVGIALLLIFGIHVIAEQSKVETGSYLVSLSVFFLAVAISTSGFSVESLIIYFFWAGAMVSILSLLFVSFYPSQDNRIVQMSAAFASVFIFVRLTLRPVSLRLFLIASLCLLAGAYSIYIEAARSAGLLVSLSALAVLVAARTIPVAWRLTIFGAQLILALLVATISQPQSRWLGGDAAVEVAGIPINTNGRLDMWEDSVVETLPSQVPTSPVGLFDRWLPTLIGSGLGESSERSMASNGQPTPLNEFVRLWTDLGLVGLAMWCVVLGAVFLIGVWTCLRTPDKGLGIAMLLLAVGLTVFSLTESMVSYSWVLLPCALLVGSSSARLRRETPGARQIKPATAPLA